MTTYSASARRPVCGKTMRVYEPSGMTRAEKATARGTHSYPVHPRGAKYSDLCKGWGAWVAPGDYVNIS